MTRARLRRSLPDRSVSSRRGFLRGIATGGVVGVAGCGAGTNGLNESQSTTDTRDVITGTSFAGTDLVVQLRDGHRVSRLNLIGPDGELFRQADVATGATTVRLPILSIAAGGRSEHYTPGEHELVSVVGEETYSHTLDLRPDLGITDVGQYRDSIAGADYGQLVVTVENTGTAPTWVYSIVYEDAPNFAANNELSGNPGTILLSVPTEKSEVILPSEASKEYIGSFPPLFFDDDQQKQCEQENFEFTIVVGTPLDPPLTQQIHIQTRGEVVGAGLAGQYTCKRMRIQLIPDSDGGD